MVNTVVQLLLLILTAFLVFYFLNNRRKARAKAGVKIGFLLLVISAIWAVLRPDDVTVIANWLGVDRGTDLMLYVLIMAFGFTTMSTWIRFREQELRYARLARAIALQNAVRPEESYKEFQS
ncbi:DUF2304 domain-containing protein [Corynebacterium felinum]|uniref:DUF2304 domain-containing protein n=1 Tax=Corynebacterium felinum TaxID=131318 RepID=A0ABU2B7B1_9CORY|nr:MULTISPECIES: DUF2304 domain-containing protein [Corynebacterium]MDF5821170.1 DUF2304 domain-containing protein [Corynebacterium felinum]MDO4762178.1 DUF2304 domain-containing protein [Corynebacterium sp.]MDR7354496.1 hypothetical protein [Corynebacterium felinum]WJY93865.1 hypothetical protein CFELI_01085 [Corynebacterium felinum]